ncbi:MAG: iron-sulfur cluster assembly protein [Chloroflexi bacterium]|nr:iron-sulfur cluster assembly protein [Chloroflexota bacterium]
MSLGGAVSEQAVLDALRDVLDPELDESVVDLAFVDRVQVDEERVEVVLRLPTFWCAPNFAYLMAHDAREAVRQAVAPRRVEVRLKDHFASDEISHGVSHEEPFDRVFGEQADGEDLTDLRRRFQTKAFTMRLEQLVRLLLEHGLTASQVTGLRLVDVLAAPAIGPLVLRLDDQLWQLDGGGPVAVAYLRKRRQLRLDLSDSAPLVTDVDGVPIAADELSAYLLRARRQRISMAFNSIFCRGMLETRYGKDEP